MGIIIEHPLLGSTIETLIDVICIIGFILFVGAFVVLPVRLHHSFSAKSVMKLINSVLMWVDTLHMSISTTWWVLWKISICTVSNTTKPYDKTLSNSILWQCVRSFHFIHVFPTHSKAHTTSVSYQPDISDDSPANHRCQQSVTSNLQSQQYQSPVIGNPQNQSCQPTEALCAPPNYQQLYFPQTQRCPRKQDVLLPANLLSQCIKILFDFPGETSTLGLFPVQPPPPHYTVKPDDRHTIHPIGPAAIVFTPLPGHKELYLDDDGNVSRDSFPVTGSKRAN